MGLAACFFAFSSFLFFPLSLFFLFFTSANWLIILYQLIGSLLSKHVCLQTGHCWQMWEAFNKQSSSQSCFIKESATRKYYLLLFTFTYILKGHRPVVSVAECGESCQDTKLFMALAKWMKALYWEHCVNTGWSLLLSNSWFFVIPQDVHLTSISPSSSSSSYNFYNPFYLIPSWIQTWWLGRPLKYTELTVHYHAGSGH